MTRLLLAASLVALAACAAETSPATNDDNLEVAPDVRLTDAMIAPRAARFRFGGEGPVVATKQLKTETSTSAAGRLLKLTAAADAGVPLVYLQLSANGPWKPGTVSCADDPQLAFVAFEIPQKRTATMLAVAPTGQRTKRACTVVVERVESWDDLDPRLKTGIAGPTMGKQRFLVRAHYEAALGLETEAGDTTQVSGSFDLWDDL